MTLTLTIIVTAMLITALLESVVPLQARASWNRIHLGPNLTLTATTFVTNGLLDAGLVALMLLFQAHDMGLLHLLVLPSMAQTVIVFFTLDFAFYIAHVSMHHVSAFWRFHRVHHSDPAVDVTTAFRQHPGESVIRYLFVGTFALALGATPVAYAAYRLCSALSALLEHANIRLPPALDAALSLLFTWPNMHKVHHSRVVQYTNSNYGNLVSWWDRMFFTFTPSRLGANIHYGLDGFDAPAAQTAAALLVVPLHDRPY